MEQAQKKVINNYSTEYLKIILILLKIRKSSKDLFNFGADPDRGSNLIPVMNISLIFTEFFFNKCRIFIYLFSSFLFIFMLKLDELFRDKEIYSDLSFFQQFSLDFCEKKMIFSI